MGRTTGVWGVVTAATELIVDALREIRAHPLRSMLTLTGIVFGAASVVSMTSLSAAIKTVAFDEMERLGMPRTVTLVDRGPRSDATRAADLRATGLRNDDVEALRDLPGEGGVFGTTYAGPRLVATARDQRTVVVDGIDAGYMSFREWPVVRGREIAPLDVFNAARVVVLGQDLVEPFFGGADPIGRTIEIEGIPFRVVGVVAPVEINFIPTEMSFMARRVFIPYTYLSRYFYGQNRISNVRVRAADAADLPTVIQAAEDLVRRRHRGADDFFVENNDADILEELAMVDRISTGWDVVLFTIAGVTMLVGGIGLFSVLLISVRERVREIGIRQALGADDRDIRWLFLVESLTLAMLGGTVGIAAGAGLVALTETITRGFGHELLIPLHVPGTLLAAGFALIVGMVFGWYPARRAARLDPIEAIRDL
jgi:putative ABC transport system permease protein